MESSLGHKHTDQTYCNSFGIFTTSCLKIEKRSSGACRLFYTRAFLSLLSWIFTSCLISGLMKRILESVI